MKNVIKLALVAAGIFSFAQSQAHNMPADSIKYKVKRDARQVGHATAHAAATADAAVTDKRYEGKYGPRGEAIYINKHSHYYYVNKAGHRVYLTRAELHNKPM
jgi:hypothetical protein